MMMGLKWQYHRNRANLRQTKRYPRRGKKGCEWIFLFPHLSWTRPHKPLCWMSRECMQHAWLNHFTQGTDFRSKGTISFFLFFNPLACCLLGKLQKGGKWHLFCQSERERSWERERAITEMRKCCCDKSTGATEIIGAGILVCHQINMNHWSCMKAGFSISHLDVCHALQVACKWMKRHPQVPAATLIDQLLIFPNANRLAWHPKASIANIGKMTLVSQQIEHDAL